MKQKIETRALSAGTAAFQRTIIFFIDEKMKNPWFR